MERLAQVFRIPHAPAGTKEGAGIGQCGSNVRTIQTCRQRIAELQSHAADLEAYLAR
jgi:hypothetical protein